MHQHGYKIKMSIKYVRHAVVNRGYFICSFGIKLQCTARWRRVDAGIKVHVHNAAAKMIMRYVDM